MSPVPPMMTSFARALHHVIDRQFVRLPFRAIAQLYNRLRHSADPIPTVSMAAE